MIALLIATTPHTTPRHHHEKAASMTPEEIRGEDGAEVSW